MGSVGGTKDRVGVGEVFVDVRVGVVAGGVPDAVLDAVAAAETDKDAVTVAVLVLLPVRGVNDGVGVAEHIVM
jgi:hypothetical protein